MKLNRKWLNEEYVDLSGVPDREFVETMTIAGQKVETYERLDAELRNVVVGRVVSITRHTNSDHMWVCQIDVGAGEPVQIVTGAQNVHEGDLVPVAQHNSWLPGGVHITKGKLRGEVSNGMLCSLKELGLTLNDFPMPLRTASGSCRRTASPATTSTPSSATTTPLWTLRSRTTARTAIPSSVWPARPLPPSTSRWAITTRSCAAVRQASCPSCWKSRFPQRTCAAATPRAWYAM